MLASTKISDYYFHIQPPSSFLTQFYQHFIVCLFFVNPSCYKFKNCKKHLLGRQVVLQTEYACRYAKILNPFALQAILTLFLSSHDFCELKPTKLLQIVLT